jgi:hypothetical protein
MAIAFGGSLVKDMELWKKKKQELDKQWDIGMRFLVGISQVRATAKRDGWEEVEFD